LRLFCIWRNRSFVCKKICSSVRVWLARWVCNRNRNGKTFWVLVKSWIMQGTELCNQSNWAKSTIHPPPECMLTKFNLEEQAIVVSCLVSTLAFQVGKPGFNHWSGLYSRSLNIRGESPTYKLLTSVNGQIFAYWARIRTLKLIQILHSTLVHFLSGLASRAIGKMKILS
jgi:hypothetical protein